MKSLVVQNLKIAPQSRGCGWGVELELLDVMETRNFGGNGSFRREICIAILQNIAERKQPPLKATVWDIPCFILPFFNPRKKREFRESGESKKVAVLSSVAFRLSGCREEDVGRRGTNPQEPRGWSERNHRSCMLRKKASEEVIIPGGGGLHYQPPPSTKRTEWDYWKKEGGIRIWEAWLFLHQFSKTFFTQTDIEKSSKQFSCQKLTLFSLSTEIPPSNFLVKQSSSHSFYPPPFSACTTANGKIRSRLQTPAAAKVSAL